MICGYAVMVILITLVQEGIFGGVGYIKSTKPVLLMAGIGTFTSAVLGGLTASFIFRNPGYTPHLLMCVLLAIETTYLITNEVTKDPVWFDLLASFTLLVGIVSGWFLYSKYIRGGKATLSVNQ
jgi:predicted membrane protein